MSELASANWNFQYGIENPKNVLNKTSSLGVLPINQHYVFFKNGATSLIQNDQNISPEVKKVLEDERISRGRNSHGDGTERPIAFTENQMSDLYYNSYGLDFSVGSIGMPIDPLTVVLFTGGQTSLFGLLASIGIASTLQAIAFELFYSATSFRIPKIGYTDYYTYETKDASNKVNKILSQIVKRKHPYVDDQNRLQKDQLVNLSSEAGFKKTIGVSSYDTILSKYQFNAGAGFFSSPFKQINRDSLRSFVDNLKANASIKYEQLNKLKEKYPSDGGFINQSKSSEEFILESIRSRINGILTPISLYIDFSDYKTVLIGSSQKGYPNPQKEKSIFGPYICRSKKTFVYYPKIIITHPKYSTLGTLSNGIVFGGGGINVFGGYPTIYSTASSNDFGSFSLIVQIASLGIPPTIGGFCNYMNKDKAFNLGAGYSEDVQTYKAEPIC
jgi:hypothetical protein